MEASEVAIPESKLLQAMMAMLAILWSTVMVLGGFAWGTKSAQEAIRGLSAEQAVMNAQLNQMGERLDRLHMRLDRIEGLDRVER